MLYHFLLAIGGSALLLSIWAAVIRMGGETREASLPAPDSSPGMASNGTMECGRCGYFRKCSTTGPGPSMNELPGCNSHLATPKTVSIPTINQEHGS
jgi:hypothetical protein